MDKINENIAEFRELRGWSRRELAEQMRKAGTDIGETAIRRIEGGQREVRIAEGISFAKVFNTTLDALANERPSTYQVMLDHALSDGGKKHLDLLIGIERFVIAVYYLKSIRELIGDPEDDAPAKISVADLVISESRLFLEPLEKAYVAIYKAGQTLGVFTSRENLCEDFAEMEDRALMDFKLLQEQPEFLIDEDQVNDDGSR